MSARWLLVVLSISALCSTQAVNLDHSHGSRIHKLKEEIDNTKSGDEDKTTTTTQSGDAQIKFVKPKDVHTEPLDRTVYSLEPAIIGTQPPAIQRIPTPPSSFTHAPRIITKEDLKPDEDLYGDSDSQPQALVATADSHTQEPSTPSTPSTPLEPTEPSTTEAPPTPTESEVENSPVDDATGSADADPATSEGTATDGTDTDSTDTDEIGENEQDARHKFRNALANDAIPKWFNVKDFVDEEIGLESEDAKVAATKIVEDLLSKFKTEFLGTIMEQFGKIIAAQNNGGGDSGDDYDYDYDYDDGYGGDAEGEGETYHQGYLDGEDDASNRGEATDATEPAAGAEASAGGEAAPAETPQDKQVIASLQAQIDQMQTQLAAAEAGKAAAAAAPTTEGGDAAAAASAAATAPVSAGASLGGEAPLAESVGTSLGAVGETPAASTETPIESTSSSPETALAPTESTEAPVTATSEPSPAEPATSSSSEEGEATSSDDAGSDDSYDDYGYGDDYGYDYDDYGYGDDYDYYDYDSADGGEEWGHDQHGRWGRKWGGGGGWGQQGGGMPIRSFGQSGGSGGFTTTVASNKPQTITTVIGTKVTPLGNGQTSISQNVERVQVSEYDEGVGSPGWVGNYADAPVASPATPVSVGGSVTEPATPAVSVGGSVTEPATPSTPLTEPAMPVSAPAAPVAAAAVTEPAAASAAAQAIASIHAATQSIIAPHPQGVDLKALKALEDSSELLTKAADEVQRLSSFREKRRLERMLKR